MIESALGAREGELEIATSAIDRALTRLGAFERFGRFPHRNAVAQSYLDARRTGVPA